ncbi:MAG: hypothetical protein SPLUMA1_SPLUMAMAG1_00686 [uncultured Sulfurimonas sp.]|nr:MAG: hypothetical protein SPLUMA1_SPLUMAMAG1_00686 [uncultured Sulfurimonas sp.]
MLWVKDREGTYIYANQSLCHGLLMAKSTEEVVGKMMFFLPLEKDVYIQRIRIGILLENSASTVI